MDKFIGGFFTGLILKNKVNLLSKYILTRFIKLYHAIHKNKNASVISNDLITEISFICAVKNTELFDEYFSNGKVQPYWDYFPTKKVIKIVLDKDVCTYFNYCIDDLNLTILDVLMISTLDYPFFKELGDTFLYVNYKIDNHTYINVYNEVSVISSCDFEVNKTPIDFANTICCSVHYNKKTEYISNYFKSFFNQTKINLTPQIMLYNYDKLDIDNFKFVLVNNHLILEKPMNEILN